MVLPYRSIILRYRSSDLSYGSFCKILIFHGLPDTVKHFIPVTSITAAAERTSPFINFLPKNPNALLLDPLFSSQISSQIDTHTPAINKDVLKHARNR